MRKKSVEARAAGLLAGVLLDQVFADPRRFHPVAGFGRVAMALERRLYADSRLRGVLFTGTLAAAPPLLAVILQFPSTGTARSRRGEGVRVAGVTAVATWAVLGGASLGREGVIMARALKAGDLEAARGRLSHLCARDPSGLDAPALARATVESIAENTSDAVVAPLFWGAVAGVPGLLAYRAINTLDAMVGYRSARYERFGWAAARLDDVVNWLPARLTGLIVVACAPLAGDGTGAARRSYDILRRDGAAHPSPNAGRCEAAFAGALGVRLGGSNVYGGRVDHRPELGDGDPPQVPDIARAVRLSRAVTFAAGALAAATTLALAHTIAAATTLALAHTIARRRRRSSPPGHS